ncbi:DUF4064 domain-containing protein [Oceanobacillus sp. J11TS1]|uniref:DUF4064 domain-containing protein n=1 Tax=Oceanobacillus sp. J11TS1 TaxID=2807191 RepID=UPI001B113AFB|nr:DUF4064 domain-containing protein [Oceanobacillus sp. J11TS1]GIO22728.1 hypothetical protein J11TS1_13090 [Oceanobacillus sp. J11TS1]
MEIKEIKYTVSIILIVIGLLSFGVLAMNSYSMLDNLETDEEFKGYIEDTLENAGDKTRSATMEEQIDFFSNSVLFIITISVICVLLGMMAIIFLSKRKKVKLVGILLTVIAVLSTVLTLGLGVIASIAYLIAGVITLLKHRKAQKVVG